MYDTWVIDRLLQLYRENHPDVGHEFFPAWSCVSAFADTEERFGNVQLCSDELHAKLSTKVEELMKGDGFKLSRDKSFLAETQGCGLPFTPLHTVDEKRLFNTMMTALTAQNPGAQPQAATPDFE